MRSRSTRNRQILVQAALACAAFAIALAISPAVARAQDKSIKPEGEAKVLTERASGDIYYRAVDEGALKYVLPGPKKYQVKLRINLAPTDNLGRGAGWKLSADGRPVSLAKLQAKPTDKPWEEGWKETGDEKGSQPLGLFVEVGADKETWEIGPDGAGALGAAVRVEPAEGAASPLGADTKTVRKPEKAAAPPAAAKKPAAKKPPEAKPEEAKPEEAKPEEAKPEEPEAKEKPAPADREGFDLSMVSALGGGINFDTANVDVGPFLGYRLWFHEMVGGYFRAAYASRAARESVATTPSGEPTAGGESANAQSVNADLRLGVFVNALRSENSAFFITGGAGPALVKLPRRELGLGLRAGGALGIEFSPASIPGVGFTVEGGLWVTSLKDPELGTSLSPTLTLGFQHYLNRGFHQEYLKEEPAQEEQARR